MFLNEGVVLVVGRLEDGGSFWQIANWYSKYLIFASILGLFKVEFGMKTDITAVSGIIV